MAVSISGLRRNIKNVAHNYTDAQVKVREATSNDPWGPSSTQMSEIADLTYNVVAFSEIMQMIWKRLNDHGKNWRHVYKSLVLLEYLIKTGSEKVGQQCKENIFAIQTLKDFQYLDDNKDQGINVREKAKTLVALLKDDERLRNERVRALKAKERFAQSTAGIGSDTVYNYNRDQRMEHGLHRRSPTELELSSELEAARPQTAGEEELQLQLALAMSREEAEQEETKTKSDDMRLQLALQKSKEASEEESKRRKDQGAGGKPSNDLLELADINFGNPLAQPPPAPTRTAASTGDPWGMVEPANNDPWGGSVPAVSSGGDAHDPWSPVQHAALTEQPRASPLAHGGLRSPGTNGDLYPALPNDPWNPVPQNGSGGLGSHPDSAFSALAVTSKYQNNNDPWSLGGAAPPKETQGGHIDPFSPNAQKQLQEFDLLREEIDMHQAPMMQANAGTTSPNPFDLGEMRGGLTETGARPKKGVQSIIEEHSNLVNLDNLLTTSKNQAVRNPFEQQPANPFQTARSPKPAMNQLLSGGPSATSAWPTQPVQPARQPQQDFNPFF